MAAPTARSGQKRDIDNWSSSRRAFGQGNFILPVTGQLCTVQIENPNNSNVGIFIDSLTIGGGVRFCYLSPPLGAPQPFVGGSTSIVTGYNKRDALTTIPKAIITGGRVLVAALLLLRLSIKDPGLNNTRAIELIDSPPPMVKPGRFLVGMGGNTLAMVWSIQWREEPIEQIN